MVGFSTISIDEIDACILGNILKFDRWTDVDGTKIVFTFHVRHRTNGITRALDFLGFFHGKVGKVVTARASR